MRMSMVSTAWALSGFTSAMLLTAGGGGLPWTHCPHKHEAGGRVASGVSVKLEEGV